MDNISATKAGKDVYTEFGKREELAIHNKRFRTEPPEVAGPDNMVTETANYTGGLPDISGSDSVNIEYVPGYVELFPIGNSS